MADDTVKKLLVKLNLSTKDWQQAVKEIRSKLTDLNETAKRDAKEMKAVQREQITLTKQQLDEQKQLTAEAKKMAAIDQAKAAWEKTNQEALRTKIQQRILETSELKKQQVQQLASFNLEKQQLLLDKERARVAEEQVNLFKVGTLKAAVGFQPFRAPQEGLTLERQVAVLSEEKQRLLILEAQARVIAAQGKYRKVDIEEVQRQIAVERARAVAQEAQVRQEQVRLKLLEQEAIAAAKVASVQGVGRLKTAIGFQPLAAPVAAQGASLEIQEATLIKERQKFATMEAELRVLSTQENVRKVDVLAVEKELVVEKARLSLEETLLKVRQQSARAESLTVHPTEVAQLKTMLGFQAFTAPQAGGIMGRFFGPSATQQFSDIAKQKEKLTLMQAQLKTIADQSAFRKIDIAVVEKEIAAERNKLTLMQMQLAEKKKTVGTGFFGGGIARETGGPGGVIGRAVSGLTGGGMLGTIAGGAFLGTGLMELITIGAEKIRELGKELVNASGPAQQLRAEFERLAQRAGKDPEKMLMDLRASTRGLVSDVDLYKIANNLLRQNVKVTSEELSRLVSNTVNLASGMGKQAPEVAHALELAFLNPQRGMMALARITGIQVRVLQLAMQGLPANIDPATRATIMFNKVLEEEEKMLKRVGVPATTLPELMQQISNAEKNFIDDMARGVLSGGKFGASIADMSKRLSELAPQLEKIAIELGGALANAIKWIVDHMHELKVGAEALMGLKLLDWTVKLTGGYRAWGSAIGWVISQTKALMIAQEATQAVGLEAVGTGVAVSTAGAATAGIVAAGALQYAALREQGVSMKQAKDAVGEWITELKEAEAERVQWQQGLISGAKLIVDAWLDTFIPGWESVWSRALSITTQYQEKTKEVLEGVFAWALEHSPFGQVAKEVKELSDAAETRRVAALIAHPTGLDQRRGGSTGVEFVPVPEKETPPELTIAQQKQIAQMKMKIEEEIAKERLVLERNRIQQEESMVRDEYDTNMISLKKYVEEEKSLKLQDLTARQTEITQETQAQLKELETQRTTTIDGHVVQLMDERIYQEKRTLILEGETLKRTQAEATYNMEVRKLDKQVLDDQQAAYRTYVDEINKLSKEGVTNRIAILKTEFDQGRVSADDYIAQRQDLIEEEYRLTLNGLEEKKKAYKDNEQEIAKINVEQIQAQIDREKQLTELILQQDELRLKASQTRFTQAKQYLEAEIATAKGSRAGEAAAKEEVATEALLNITRQYITEQETQLKTVDQFSDTWVKIQEQIASATKEEQQLNLQLAQARDIAGPLSGIFGEIAGIFGKLGGPASRGIADLLTNMSGAFSQISQFSVSMAQTGGPGALFGNLGKSFTALFKTQTIETEAPKTAQEIFQHGLTSSTSALDQFTSALLQATDSASAYAIAAKAQVELLRSKQGQPAGELPKYQEGTDEVPETGPAILHKGETVLTAEESKKHKTWIQVIRQKLSTGFQKAAQRQKPSVMQSVFNLGKSFENFVPQTGTQTMAAAANILGLGGNIPKGVLTGQYGITNYLSKIPQPYQGTASFIEALNPQFATMLTAAMQSPPGSQKRKAVAQQMSQYKSDVQTSGRDFSGLLNWVQSGATVQMMPSYQLGGTVAQTGPAYLHANETVLTSGMTAALTQFTALIKAATDALQKLVLTLSSISTKPTAVLAAAAPISVVGGRIPQIPGPQLAENVPVPTGPGGVVGKVPESLDSITSGLNQLPLPKVSSAADQLAKSLGDAAKVPFAEKLKDFASNLTGVIQGLMGAMSSVTSGKTGAGGALSGATGLGMEGMQLGMAAGPMGAAIGGAAGLVTGGIMGGIFGAKEEQLQQDLHKIQTQMQGILDSMNEGTISLSQAIKDLRAERQQAVAMLSQDPKGGKGGGKGGKKGFQPSQAQAAIEQIDQQIQALVNEQKQILDNLHQSLIELSQPIQFQSYLQSLDEIIQKYQQFASAASGNAQEVGLAQQYLNDSLQNYVTTLGQQLNAAQQQAIQNALELINLEYQRQQIINQEAQQEYDILTQGVLARQRTTAMTKGQEIGNLRYQRDMQLQQINEQIALQQYKVDTETKIFGLATTRIGLETQLLAAQEEQAQFQDAQTAALAQVIAQLQQGMASGSLMQQISQMYAGGTLPTGTGILSYITQQLGLSANIPPGVLGGQYGATNLLAEVPQQYQSAANYVSEQDPNFLTDLASAMQSAAGSPERQGVAQEVTGFQSQGQVEGFDMQGLIGWIKTGTMTQQPAPGSTPTPPSYQTGTWSVPETGPAILHEGETVLPAPFNQFMQMMNGFTAGVDTASKTPIMSSTLLTDQTGTTDRVIGAKLDAENQLMQMTSARTGLEMTVISARQDQLSMEMQYLATLNSTLDRVQSLSNAGSMTGGSLEALFQQVYQTRGRYGSGNFRRETL